MFCKLLKGILRRANDNDIATNHKVRYNVGLVRDGVGDIRKFPRKIINSPISFASETGRYLLQRIANVAHLDVCA